MTETTNVVIVFVTVRRRQKKRWRYIRNAERQNYQNEPYYGCTSYFSRLAFVTKPNRYDPHITWAYFPALGTVPEIRF